MNPYLRFHIGVQTWPLAPASAPATRPGWRPDGLTAPLLRRVIGKALIDRHCPFGAPRCQTLGGGPRKRDQVGCTLAPSCPYAALFAPQGRQPPFALFMAPPRNGSALLELTLFADACSLYPWVLGAVADALAGGVGKARVPWRFAAVARVMARGRRHRLCRGDLTRLPHDLVPDELPLEDQAPAPAGDTTVDLMSPTRLFDDGKPLQHGDPVPFALLVTRTLGRIEGVYGSAASRLLAPDARKAVVAQATAVKLVDDQTRWRETRDYSARHRKEIPLGGKVGRLTYRGAGAFGPLLRTAEVLHVGKNATAGCGRIRVAGRQGNPA